MFFSMRFGTLVVACAAMMASITTSAAERIDRGSQIIDGTSVNTTIYHERGYAIFENSCGSQRLSQSALQGGAKPTNIIPCPRRSSTPAPLPETPSTSTGKRLWSAVAAGIRNGFLGVGSRVSAGHSMNNDTKAEASAKAVRACQKNGVSCSVVATWNTGCYYITVSVDNSNPVAWGSGPTAQDAYNECFKRIKEGNCVTNTLGSCYPN